MKKSINFMTNSVKTLMLCMVLFCISAGVHAQSATAKIEKIWVDHNVTENGEMGMRIHVKFLVNNMLGKTGSCVAWFYFSSGEALKSLGADQRYKTPNGKLAISDSYKPAYENASFNDFKLFMPYSELHLKSGKLHDLKFKIGIMDNNSKQIAISTDQEFTYDDR